MTIVSEPHRILMKKERNTQSMKIKLTLVKLDWRNTISS